MKFIVFFIIVLSFHVVKSQDDLKTYIKKYKTTFSQVDSEFKGEGWNKIDSAIKNTNHVVIGEDHFTNEIPAFISAIARSVKFDNFFIEVDPYSTAILQDFLTKKSTKEQEEFIKTNGDLLSFYALEPELNLAKQFIGLGAALMGADQITSVADQLLCSELKKITKSRQAKLLYEKMEVESKKNFEIFLKNPSNGMYMLKPDFDETVNALLKLNISETEREQLEAMKISKRIYTGRDHFLRLQLIKNIFYKKYYSGVLNKKTLYKYGATHSSKSEGLLGGYDIGNLVYNIADSRYEKSIHIMILGKGGMRGSPFRAFPNSKVGSTDMYQKQLASFFEEVDGNQWHLFDLRPIQQAINRNKLQITDRSLNRVLMGFDYIVIIPEVSPATFPK